MNQSALRSAYLYSKAAAALAAVAGSAAANGAAIDRTGYDSLTADVAYTVTGAPAAASLSLQLQDSPDGNTAWANYGAAAVTALGASGVASLGLDIRGARQFVRVVSTPTLTGGTSPSVNQSGTARLYGPDSLPAA